MSHFADLKYPSNISYPMERTYASGSQRQPGMPRPFQGGGGPDPSSLLHPGENPGVQCPAAESPYPFLDRRATAISGVRALARIPFVIVLAAVAVITLGVALTVTIPCTVYDAMEHADGVLGERSMEYHWKCPLEGGGSKGCTLVLDIAREDVDASLSSGILRKGTVLVPAPVLLIDADDPYVRQVAEHIASETGGCSEETRATAALNFVQTAVRYVSDQELYGAPEFWASPVETLYNHCGDCEDQAVLLCSLFGALGIRCVLLDYPGHIAAGVFIGDSEELLFCEATCDIPTDLGYGVRHGQQPESYSPEESFGLGGLLSNGLARYRDLIGAATGL